MYAYDAIPQTPDMLFDTERLMFGILNKTPQAVHLLSGMCARVFEQNQKSLSAWIATRGDIYFSNLMDETQIYYDKSGQAAERNRVTGDKVTTIADDLPVFSVPYLEATQQGGVEHNVLEHDRSVGSVFSFPDNTLHLRAGEYTSNKRDTKACSWESNGRHLYKFDEFLRHAFEFFPVERDCGSRVDDGGGDGGGGHNPDAGKLNRKLLMQLVYSRPFTHTETQKEGNERRLHTFLKYESRRNTWHPINVVGEIDEANCKDRYLHNVYKTMQYALEKNLSAEERQHLQAGMELAEELNRYRPIPAFLAAVEADAGATIANADGYGVTLRAAKSGVITGILLAVARISGETAPLLFTALNNQFWNSNMNQPMANLPIVIFQFAMSPYEDWHTLAWAGALLITASVLTLNIVARWLGSKNNQSH